MDIQAFKKEILKDGTLHEDDIYKIKDFLSSDGGMNKEKANFLFELKNNATKGKLPASFKKHFVNSISAMLLEDETSPGEIDEDEAKWLRAKIQYNGRIDDYDRALLNNLKEKSINFPEILQFKSFRTRKFESALYGLRYLSILAVIGAGISSIVLFIQGVILIYWGIKDYLNNVFTPNLNSHQQDLIYENLFEKLVSSVDVFLFALVLVIFSAGVYELFVSKIDPVERGTDSRPSWLRINSVDDLKSSLGKVILMVLIVSFFKHILAFQNWNEPISYFYLAAGIFLISAALYLTHKSHSDSHHDEHKEDHNKKRKDFLGINI